MGGSGKGSSRTKGINGIFVCGDIEGMDGIESRENTRHCVFPLPLPSKCLIQGLTLERKRQILWVGGRGGKEEV